MPYVVYFIPIKIKIPHITVGRRRTTTLKKIIGVILAVILGITMVSCDMISSIVKKEEVVLNTVSMFGGDNDSSNYYHEIINSYEEQYGITVNDVSDASSEIWKTSVRTSFQVGNEPDVLFFFTGAEVVSIIEMDAFVDIDTIREEYPEYGENINEAAMAFMTETDGLAYALPIRGFWEGLFINEDLFNAYNLELPTTWASFTKAIETFSQTEIVPIAASFFDEPHYLIEHLILAYGGVEEHGKSLVSGEAAPESWVEGLNLFKKLSDLGAFAENVSSTTNADAQQLFIDKKAAMIVDGSWLAEGLLDQTDTTVISFPSYSTNQKEETDIIGGFSSGFYISKKAWNDPEKREAAVRFVETMTSDDSITKFATAGGAPAANVGELSNVTDVQEAGIHMSSNAIHIEMPIDSRINKLSWNYIIANVSAIVDGTADARNVLNNAANMNK